MKSKKSHLVHLRDRAPSDALTAACGVITRGTLPKGDAITNQLIRVTCGQCKQKVGEHWFKTECIPNLNCAEYLIFPRLTALAEVDWSPKSTHNFDDFSRRLQIEFQRFDRLGVNYRRITTNAPAVDPAK
jgi:hypothetical protein